MKKVWKIEKYNKWDIRVYYRLDEVAYLYCGLDPAADLMQDPPYPHKGYLSAAMSVEINKSNYPNTHTPDYKYEGTLPDDTWVKVIDAFKVLLSAEKFGSLSTRNDMASRDDLKTFFSERLGERPKFLFPSERKPSRRSTKKIARSPIVGATLNKRLTVKEAAVRWNKSEDTIRRWIIEEKLIAEKDPGGRNWWITGFREHLDPTDK